MKRVALGALGLAITASAWANTPIPAAIRPAAGEQLEMTLSATGVQIYECRSGAWTFVAPDADLFDAKGRRVGHHGAGPYWQADDGSRVVGTVAARVEAPLAGTIPWLLLTTRSTGPQGAFGKVTSIQRVDTTGGAPPATTCAHDAAGAQARVNYTAIYRLFSSK
ncbi:MAG TPA: DUF3455 domain-containing protein [Reyranellaceae bacterium]|nr:DUF3455 domain-containing protein [Reyranellaceae bacterium]